MAWNAQFRNRAFIVTFGRIIERWYLHSHEHEDAISELALLCGVEQWSLSTWDIDRGLSPPIADAEDPLSAIHAFRNREGEGTNILVLQNFHRFLQSAEIVQAIHHAVVSGKTTRNIVVILSPVVQLPVELATLFVTVEHARPNRRQLLEIARGVAVNDEERPADDQMAPILDAASGTSDPCDRVEDQHAVGFPLGRGLRRLLAAASDTKTS
ncbi:hypothetical protein [Rhodopirellula europaea]|uniref:AAA ATPase central domain protein n=1 Tax=Rhodopirellula europaea 6C TaxID=1263867 RepID=M2AKD0_9BACT|nr:AAA ATPase central domain protein [Rhodopirellula europaea 6C]